MDTIIGDSAIAGARERFERFRALMRPINGKTCKLSFDAILERLNEKHTLLAISKEAEVSPQAMSQTYKRYFEPHLGMTARKRFELQARAGIEWESEYLQSAIALARNSGCSVGAWYQGRYRLRHELNVSGRRWQVHHLRKLWRPAPYMIRRYFHGMVRYAELTQRYGHFYITEAEGIQHIFVIPTKDLVSKLALQNDGTRASVYFPEHPRESDFVHNHRMNVWPYENAAHLLCKSDNDVQTSPLA